MHEEIHIAKWNGKAGTSIQRPGSISQNVIAIFVGCRTMTFPAAPCKTEMQQVRSFTSLQIVHTHPQMYIYMCVYIYLNLYMLGAGGWPRPAGSTLYVYPKKHWFNCCDQITILELSYSGQVRIATEQLCLIRSSSRCEHDTTRPGNLW